MATQEVKNFISDEEMNSHVSAGRATIPNFIPDEKADSYFGNVNSSNPSPVEDTFLQGHPILKGTSDILGTTGLAKGITQSIFLNFTPEGKNVQKMLQEGKISADDFDRILGGGLATNKEIIGSAVQTAANIGAAGIGKATAATKLGRIAQTAGKLGGVSAISGGAQAYGQGKSMGDIAKEATLSGGIGAGLGAAGQGIGELASYLTSPHVTEGMYNRAIGVSPRELVAGKNPAKTLIGEGIGGTKNTILNKSRNLASNLEDQVSQIVKDNPQRFSSNQVLGQIKGEISKKFGNALSSQEVQKIVDNLPLNPLKSNQYLSVRQLNALRSTLDNKFLGNGKWLSEATTEKITGLKTATNIMRGIVQNTDQRLPGLFSKWSNTITAVRSLDRDLAKPHALSKILEYVINPIAGIPFRVGTSAPVATGVARGLNAIGKSNIPSTVGKVAKTITPAISAKISNQ